jgi:uncharacterized protein YbaR (Trm112 family)/2-polyprenyl-3-methyl-5-hydroxy-6-metoxy-1,4-benzoquinol methylase
MKKAHLSLLCCPNCDSKSLEIDIDEQVDDEIVEGTINCSSCTAIYPITKSIPRFVKSLNYADSFGPQWNTFARSQIDCDKIKESEIRFDSEIGWTEEHLRGKTVVEFGSGAGRFLDIVSRRGAKLAIGIDATDAADASLENLKDRGNILIIQADIFNNPLCDNQFDKAYSIGVLHHTPDPEGAFQKMVKIVSGGGSVGVSLYEQSNYRRPNKDSVKVLAVALMWALNEFRCELFRVITTRIPEKVFLFYCKTIIPILHFINKVPLLRYFRYLLPSTCYRDLPVINSMVDTHDSYATKIVFKYCGRDVFQWFLKLGLSEIILRNSRSGWVSVEATVPPESERKKKGMILIQPSPPGT